MQRFQQRKRHLHRRSAGVSQLGPSLLVVRLDSRFLLSQCQPKAHIAIEVAVGNMMDKLSDGPPSGPVRRVDLLRR